MQSSSSEGLGRDFVGLMLDAEFVYMCIILSSDTRNGEWWYIWCFFAANIANLSRNVELEVVKYYQLYETNDSHRRLRHSQHQTSSLQSSSPS